MSDAIDEQIRAERVQQRRGKIVRVLLLGQSESGECLDFGVLVFGIFWVVCLGCWLGLGLEMRGGGFFSGSISDSISLEALILVLASEL